MKTDTIELPAGGACLTQPVRLCGTCSKWEHRPVKIVAPTELGFCWDFYLPSVRGDGADCAMHKPNAPVSAAVSETKLETQNP